MAPTPRRAIEARAHRRTPLALSAPGAVTDEFAELAAKAIRRRVATLTPEARFTDPGGFGMSMTAAPSSATSISGTVNTSNDRGVVLAGETSWRNWSKFAPTPRYMPSAGEVVTLNLDKQGYIRQISAADDGAELRPGPTPIRRATVAAPLAPPPPFRPVTLPSTVNEEARRIVKLSVLKSACSVWGEDTDADPAKMVTKIAYTFSKLMDLYDRCDYDRAEGPRIPTASEMAAADKAEFVAEMRAPAPRIEEDLPF